MKQPRMGFANPQGLDSRLHDGRLWEKRYDSVAVSSMVKALDAIERVSPDTYGQLHPVTVTADGLVVTGARRTEAQRIRNKPVWVRYIDDAPLEVLRALASLENLERKSLTYGQITEAAALKALETLLKLTEAKK